MLYPESVETRITNRNQAETIQAILEKILKQLAEKQKELQQTQKRADDLDSQAAAARDAGEYQKAFRLTQDAIQLRNTARDIKKKIKDLDEQHASLLYKARSGN